MIVTYFIL